MNLYNGSGIYKLVKCSKLALCVFSVILAGNCLAADSLTQPGNDKERNALQTLIGCWNDGTIENSTRSGTAFNVSNCSPLSRFDVNSEFKNSARIDIQGNFPIHDHRYFNVQVQAHKNSYAGVHIPAGVNFGATKIRNIMVRSLERNGFNSYLPVGANNRVDMTINPRNHKRFGMYEGKAGVTVSGTLLNNVFTL